MSKSSYGQILKSSAVIGGSSVINIGIGIVRTKAMAILLGPAGVGLLGMYGSIADLVHGIAGLGVNSSGVRQIAEAVGSGDTQRIGRTVVVLRRVSLVLGLLGALILIVLAKPVAALTFGSVEHAGGVALLSLAVCFRLVSNAQTALLQGTRRIAQLAKVGVLGALGGTAVSIPMVYYLGEAGVVPSLASVGAVTLLCSWWYSREVRVPTPRMSRGQFKEETASLLRLGLAFMASGLMTMGVAYVVRLTVLRQIGFEAAGLYQAAWAVGGLYVGLILQAMGTDFYPRLTGVARDHEACNRLVNEQAQVSMLLAGPGVIATLTFAPLVMALFYSSEFNAAVGILRWICLGMTLRVVAWPMGFIILAKGAQTAFFFTELAWTIIHVGLAWVCVRFFQLDGAGMAFFASYVFHGLLVYPIVRRLTGFRWSAANLRTGSLFLALIASVFCGFYLLPPRLATLLGTIAFLVSGYYSVRWLIALVPPERIPAPLRRLLPIIDLVRPVPNLNDRSKLP